MATGSTSAFRPSGTVPIAAGTTTASASLAGGGETVLITNATNAVAFVRFGSDSSITAANTDMPIQANTRALLSVNALITTVAVVLSTGSGTVYVTRGDGSSI